MHTVHTRLVMGECHLHVQCSEQAYLRFTTGANAGVKMVTAPIRAVVGPGYYGPPPGYYAPGYYAPPPAYYGYYGPPPGYQPGYNAPGLPAGATSNN